MFIAIWTIDWTIAVLNLNYSLFVNIHSWKKAFRYWRNIAKKLGRSVSTISRALKGFFLKLLSKPSGKIVGKWPREMNYHLIYAQRSPHSASHQHPLGRIVPGKSLLIFSPSLYQWPFRIHAIKRGYNVHDLPIQETHESREKKANIKTLVSHRYMLINFPKSRKPNHYWSTLMTCTVERFHRTFRQSSWRNSSSENSPFNEMRAGAYQVYEAPWLGKLAVKMSMYGLWNLRINIRKKKRRLTWKHLKNWN